jgi:hypothetical protein
MLISNLHRFLKDFHLVIDIGTLHPLDNFVLRLILTSPPHMVPPSLKEMVTCGTHITNGDEFMANFRELRHGELRRIHLPRTPVNKGKGET